MSTVDAPQTQAPTSPRTPLSAALPTIEGKLREIITCATRAMEHADDAVGQTSKPGVTSPSAVTLWELLYQLVTVEQDIEAIRALLPAMDELQAPE